MTSLYTEQNGQDRKFVATDAAGSPWSSEAQHGGPPCALLAAALEGEIDDPELRPARLKVELFRAVPTTPLSIETQVARRGHRLVSVDAQLISDRVVARANALFLRGGGTQQSTGPAPPLPGPGARVEAMIPSEFAHRFPPGFHTTVEVVTLEAQLQAAWIRVPCGLLPNQPLSAFQRAAATSDFCNALRARQVGHGAGFINVDSNAQFVRPSTGEWLGLELVELATMGATGYARANLFDAQGVFGYVEQNSLANVGG